MKQNIIAPKICELSENSKRTAASMTTIPIQHGKKWDIVPHPPSFLQIKPVDQVFADALLGKAVVPPSRVVGGINGLFQSAMGEVLKQTNQNQPKIPILIESDEEDICCSSEANAGARFSSDSSSSDDDDDDDDDASLDIDSPPMTIEIEEKKEEEEEEEEPLDNLDNAITPLIQHYVDRTATVMVLSTRKIEDDIVHFNELVKQYNPKEMKACVTKIKHACNHFEEIVQKSLNGYETLLGFTEMNFLAKINDLNVHDACTEAEAAAADAVAVAELPNDSYIKILRPKKKRKKFDKVQQKDPIFATLRKAKKQKQYVSSFTVGIYKPHELKIIRDYQMKYADWLLAGRTDTGCRFYDQELYKMIGKALNRPATGVKGYMVEKKLRLRDNYDKLLIVEMKKHKLYPWPKKHNSLFTVGIYKPHEVKLIRDYQIKYSHWLLAGKTDQGERFYEKELYKMIGKALNRPATGVKGFMTDKRLRLKDNYDKLLIVEMKKRKLYPWPYVRNVSLREEVLARSKKCSKQQKHKQQ